LDRWPELYGEIPQAETGALEDVVVDEGDVGVGAQKRGRGVTAWAVVEISPGPR
jgi:predicted fused transcriptional regulator/phosphomethylpyrimidine kinase